MDRRSFPRYHVSCVVAFSEPQLGTRLVSNLSRGGCAIVLQGLLLESGQEFSLDLSLQIDVLHVECAVVRWVRADNAGLEFVMMRAVDQAKLEAFLVTVAEMDLDRKEPLH